LQSRDHILLSNLLDQSWRAGQSLDLAALVGAIQKPPLQKLGALDLESFYPAKERMTLALAVNNLLASPRFAAWAKGEALDVQRLLYTPQGKPRIAVISIAHLPDAERMFVVTLLLNAIVSWMRQQSGTSSLRAILYMDEIFGFFPPGAMPPSKPPMLTLLKQARAFGWGCVLATQNPVDLDYKGLGNAGTWLIGRLQTERDRDRLLDGLTSALTGGGPNRAELARQLGALTPRVFLMRNVHDTAPVLLKSRWALSYLRGPLTPAEISRLMESRKSVDAQTTARSGESLTSAASPSSATIAAPTTRPALPATVDEVFTPTGHDTRNALYIPRLLGIAKLHFTDAALKLDLWQTVSLAAPLSDDGNHAQWNQADACDLDDLQTTPAAGIGFATLPAGALRAANYADYNKTLAAQLYESHRLTLFRCEAMKLTSRPDESEGDFRARLALAAREQRDARKELLRKSYAAKLETAHRAVDRTEGQAQRQHAQATQQKFSTAVSIGTTVLGALFGRKLLSSGSLNSAATAARRAQRIGRESGQAQRADENHEQAQKRYDELAKELDDALAALDTAYDAQTAPLTNLSIAPRKSDIAILSVRLLWRLA
jgi:hypothetical protein